MRPFFLSTICLLALTASSAAQASQNQSAGLFFRACETLMKDAACVPAHGGSFESKIIVQGGFIEVRLEGKCEKRQLSWLPWPRSEIVKRIKFRGPRNDVIGLMSGNLEWAPRPTKVLIDALSPQFSSTPVERKVQFPFGGQTCVPARAGSLIDNPIQLKISDPTRETGL